MGLATNQAYADLGLSLRGQLAVHLRNNLFPSMPVSMVTPCEQAINAVLDGDPDKSIDLPDAVKWRGSSSAPANALINSFNLEFFLGENDE